MNQLSYMAHAGHVHQHHNASVKGNDALIVVGVVAFIVFVVVVAFYKLGNLSKQRNVTLKTKRGNKLN